MKKRFTLLLVILTAVALGVALAACAPEPPVTYKVHYDANHGGKIEGELNQTVESGKDASAVTAVPNAGYAFDKWTDGVTTATRTDTSVTGDISVSANFKWLTPRYTLTYIASEHGAIEGEAEQSVEEKKHGTSVTAVPDEGYRFTGWSDGYLDPQRQDFYVRQNTTYTANFEKVVVKLKLNYDSGTADSTMTEVTFDIDSYKDVTLPVPSKEHFTFEGWYVGHRRMNNWEVSTWFSKEHDPRVTDDTGTVVIGSELWRYDNGEQDTYELYPKWSANETFTFKLLLVYVTRVDATLPTVPWPGQDVHVDYTMSQEERRFCEATTKQVRRTLNSMTDGLIAFEVDEYYTTQTVVTENFYINPKNNLLHPNYIPEVLGMLSGYDSALSVYSLGFNFSLYSAGGTAKAKYGEAYFDMFLNGIYANDVDIEEIVSDMDRPEWESWLEVLLHEFAHTIEQRINAADYHEYGLDLHVSQAFNLIYANRQYLLRQIYRDGIQAGIPYNFWKGDIAVATYQVEGDNGYVYHAYGVTDSTGALHCDVVYGEAGATVTATPYLGYRFVRWSDGVLTAKRTDKNFTNDFTVTAYFEQILYTVEYKAAEGGSIDGQAVQSKPLNATYDFVTAVPDEGYEFIGWSDGVTKAIRRDWFQFTDLDRFDENDTWTVTALFRKIE